MKKRQSIGKRRTGTPDRGCRGRSAPPILLSERDLAQAEAKRGEHGTLEREEKWTYIEGRVVRAPRLVELHPELFRAEILILNHVRFRLTRPI
jgi:hypothetical protein